MRRSTGADACTARQGGPLLVNAEGFARRLAQGIEALGLPVDAAIQRKMLDYAALMVEWKRVHPMTPAYGETTIVNQLLDCLAVLPHLAPGAIVDLGSGMGLPGIPLALARPEHGITLIEAHPGKSAFLRSAVSALGLTNAEVSGERVEAWTDRRRFDTVISRALCDLDGFVRLAGRLCVPGGTLAAIKVTYPHEELAQIPASFKLRAVIPLHVPDVSPEPQLVLLDRIR